VGAVRHRPDKYSPYPREAFYTAKSVSVNFLLVFLNEYYITEYIEIEEKLSLAKFNTQGVFF